MAALKICYIEKVLKAGRGKKKVTEKERLQSGRRGFLGAGFLCLLVEESYPWSWRTALFDLDGSLTAAFCLVLVLVLWSAVRYLFVFGVWAVWLCLWLHGFLLYFRFSFRPIAVEGSANRWILRCWCKSASFLQSHGYPTLKTS